MVLYFIAAVLLSLALTFLSARKGIPVLISKKMGQPILDIGPRWHKSKEGTPTMGGMFFIFAITVTTILFSFFMIPKEELPVLLITLVTSLLFGFIGFIDDRAKLVKKQNEGLKAYQKFLLQVVVSALYLFCMTMWGDLSTTLYIPFFKVEWELGYWYYLLALIFIVGMNNSVNLTDGIDGLCSSVTAVFAIFFAVCALHFPRTGATTPSMLLLSGALLGGVIGFLIYNFHPARVFMGDTGSLFLGGLLTGLAFMCASPLLIAIIGLWFIMETVSVILQVGYFKLTHKRLFKMAPIHHHFERCGLSENTIVLCGILMTAVLAVLTYFFM